MNKILISLLVAFFSGSSLLGVLLTALLASGQEDASVGTSKAAHLPQPSVSTPHGPSLSSGEQRLLDAVNKWRSGFGRKPVAVDASLETAARQRADWYADHGINAVHIAAGQSPMTAAYRAGFHGHGIGENTAQGQASPESAVFDWWAHSPGHRRNQIDPTWNRIGVGVDGHTYVTVYGK